MTETLKPAAARPRREKHAISRSILIILRLGSFVNGLALIIVSAQLRGAYNSLPYIPVQVAIAAGACAMLILPVAAALLKHPASSRRNLVLLMFLDLVSAAVFAAALGCLFASLSIEVQKEGEGWDMPVHSPQLIGQNRYTGRAVIMEGLGLALSLLYILYDCWAVWRAP
jgi:hypothetical protein